MNVNGKSRANKIRVAYVESKGHHVHMLPCGAFGSTRGLFNLAKSIGFDGTENTFWQRLKRAGGSMTLAELAVPANKVHATTKRRTQSDDVAAAIAALDARKAAMMTYIETALSAGLTPRKLEHFIREHASPSDIAAAYMTDVLTVQLLMRRWGLEHLSGRAKQNVVLLVREAQQ